MDLDQAFTPAEPRVAAKILDGELIVINLDTGYYYASTGAGVAIWKQVEAGATLRQVSAELIRCYDVPPERAERDARAFLEKLIVEALVEPGAVARSPGRPPSTTIDERVPYAPPELLKFDDMAEQFAMDPPLVSRSRT
jgi:hypothetical protein